MIGEVRRDPYDWTTTVDELPAKRPYVGGQAVIEGVMMRSPRCMAIAVRRLDGSIVIRNDAWISVWERMRFLRWPVFRGGVVLIDTPPG